MNSIITKMGEKLAGEIGVKLDEVIEVLTTINYTLVGIGLILSAFALAWLSKQLISFIKFSYYWYKAKKQ